MAAQRIVYCRNQISTKTTIGDRSSPPIEGSMRRFSQRQQDAQQAADEIVMDIDDVESRQPAHDHGGDQDPLVDFQDLDQQGGDRVHHDGHLVAAGTGSEKPENPRLA